MSTRRGFLLGMLSAPVAAVAAPLTPVSQATSELTHSFVHDMDICSMYARPIPVFTYTETYGRDFHSLMQQWVEHLQKD